MANYGDGRPIVSAVDSTYDSSGITQDRDGNVLERLEYIINEVADTQPYTAIQSESIVPITDVYSRLFVTIIDADGSAVVSNNITITGATILLEQSIAGGAYSSVGITQPTLAKTAGQVYAQVLLLAVENWDATCTYRLTVSGVVIENTPDYNLQTFIWNNVVAEPDTISTQVDAINTAITSPSTDSTATGTIGNVLGTKGDSQLSNNTSSVMNLVRSCFVSAPFRYITVTNVPDTTHTTTDSIFTAENDSFNGWWMQCFQRDNGLGDAPRGEYRQISDWVKATGVLTHTAYSAPVAVGDGMLLIHPLMYEALIHAAMIGTPIDTDIATDIANVQTTVDAITGYALDSTVAKEATLGVPTADVTTNTTVSQAVGNKTDALVTTVGTTKSLMGYIKGILTNLNLVKTAVDDIQADVNYAQKVYPTLAAGVVVTGGVSWTLGDFAEIVPASTITSQFRISHVNFADLSVNDTYEVVLYSGALASEVEIGRTRVTKTGTSFQLPVVLNTGHIAANSRISAKVASSSGNDTVTISVIYHLS